MIQHLERGELPENVVEAMTIKRQAAKYLVLDGVFYRRGRTHPFLRCLTPGEVK